jgi:hypothetical protein
VADREAVAAALGVADAVAVAEKGSTDPVDDGVAPALSVAVGVPLAVRDALAPLVSVAVPVAVPDADAVGDGDACPQHQTTPSARSAHDHVSPALTPTTPDVAPAGTGETCPLALLPAHDTLPPPAADGPITHVC